MYDANNRRYHDALNGHVLSGDVDPAEILTQTESVIAAIEAYKAFDERQPGWFKVELEPSA